LKRRRKREERKKKERKEETARLPSLSTGKEKNVFLLFQAFLLSHFSLFFYWIPRRSLLCLTSSPKQLEINSNHLETFLKNPKPQDPTHIFLALEFVRGGEFFRHLRTRGRLPEAAARAYAAEVVVALEAMHDRGVVYRDLKVREGILFLRERKKGNELSSLKINPI